MKNYSFIHIFFFLLLLMVCKCSQAQDYVVTTKGDTLRGKIRSINFGPQKSVQLTDANKKKTSIPIFQTVAYFFKGDTYNPVKNEKGYSYMKLIKPGYLSLYAFQMDNQSSYDGLYLIKRDGRGLEVPNLSFKKLITKFLDDCPEVSDRVENGSLSKRDLAKIVEEYNHCIDLNSRAPQQNGIARKEQLNKEQSSRLVTWETLEANVKSQDTFEEKENVLEMITEVKNKIKNAEKVPNFLIEGLKSALTQAALKESLENALSEME